MVKHRLSYLILGLVISCALPFLNFASGLFGEYTLSGQVFTSDGKLLKNQEICIYIGNKKDTFHTNSNGFFEIKIHWMTTCPTGKSKWRVQLENRIINPKFIKFEFKNSKIKFKNDWRNQKKVNESKVNCIIF